VRREHDHVVRPIQQPLEALIKRRRVPFDIGVLDAGLDAEFDPADALVEKVSPVVSRAAPSTPKETLPSLCRVCG